MFDSILTQLSTLPLWLLYFVAGAVAAFENIFPPFPSDLVAAFTVFVSARAGGPFWLAAIVVTVGNVIGAMLMYYVGKRYGSLVLLEKLERYAGKTAGERLQKLHAKYGVGALFISRFLPGIRALVPPFAGAMKIPAIHVFLSITVASALWYTLVTYIAYAAGENWSLIVTRVTQSATLLAVIAVIITAILLVVWYIRRRSARQKP